MLEGVLKGHLLPQRRVPPWVSILGMLEGVLKVSPDRKVPAQPVCFNPWYVGGGVKSLGQRRGGGGGVVSILGMLEGVLKEKKESLSLSKAMEFQSLVCWRGC